jgi:hypothetical protein
MLLGWFGLALLIAFSIALTYWVTVSLAGWPA